MPSKIKMKKETKSSLETGEFYPAGHYPRFHTAAANNHCPFPIQYDLTCQYLSDNQAKNLTGFTDGEGVERAWAASRPVIACKEMSPGKRGTSRSMIISSLD
ncbi:hypothetical protein B0H10DRAFT_1972469 [Mycena sp. CBHHK59/15]|nr:hypothetical protein B0H10DRAFT_1972469 [Mycena sp. CBHHK59/15]